RMASRRYAAGTNLKGARSQYSSARPNRRINMNKLLGLVVVATLPLAACSHMPMASTTTKSANTAMAASGEQYCFKRNLRQSDGKLYCNWVADRAEACNARDDRGLEVSGYGDP